MYDFIEAEEILQKRKDQKDRQKGKPINWVAIFGYEYDDDIEDYTSWSYFYFEKEEDARNFQDTKVSCVFGSYCFTSPEKKVVLPFDVYKENDELLLDDLGELQE